MSRADRRFVRGLFAISCIAVLFVSAVEAARTERFDRAAAATSLQARLEADKAWQEHHRVLKERKKAGENVEAQIQAHKTQRPHFADLKNDALRIIDANPADEAAFAAVAVALRASIKNSDDISTASFKALHARMARVLLAHHLHRVDFLSSNYLVFSNAEDGIAYWKSVFQESPYRNVRGIAASELMERHADNSNVLGLTSGDREAMRQEAQRYAQIVRENYADIGSLSERAQKTFALLDYSAGAFLPDIKVATITGGTDTLSRHRGKILLIDFWATWCGACKRDHPKLIALKQELNGLPFEIISVSADEKPELVTRYMAKERDLPWPQWYVGPQGALLKQWGIQSYPTYLLVGGDGKLQARGSTQSLGDIMAQARKGVAQIDSK